MNPLDKNTAIQTQAPQIETKSTQTKHRISPELFNPEQKTTAKKVMMIAMGILFAPLIVTGLILTFVAKAIYQPGKIIHDKIVKALNDKSLLAANERMKKGEELAKLTSLQSIVSDAKISELIHVTEKKFENPAQIAETKVIRYLQREVARGNLKLTPDEIQTMAKDIATDIADKHLSPQQVVAYHFKVFGSDYSKNNIFLNQLNKELNALNKPQAFPSFKKDLEKLVSHLKSADPDSAQKANAQFLQDLRTVLRSDAYQALKDNPTDPSIRLIHQLCVGIWNNVKVLNHYKDFGESMLNGIDRSHETADVLKQTWHKGSQELHTEKGLDLFSYKLNNMESVWGAVTSQTMIGTYDPHALSNNPSLQSITQTKLDTTDVKINNCYGGSPTIGKELSPEFLAVLQAAENNQFAKDKDRISGVPDMVSYTNFQQLSPHGGEGARSRAIMMANELFPLSFMGITLTKDTPFYKMQSDVTPWKRAEDFGKEVKAELMKNECFQLLSEYSKDQGYHFAGDQKRWELIFDTAIQLANLHFQSYDSALPLPAQATFEHKAAYLEFVYSLIQGAQELEAAQRVRAINPNLKGVTVMAIKACKENIDRGGAENVKYLYNRLPEDHPDRLSLITGAFHSRALSVRNRMILEHRTEHLFSYMEHVSSSAFKEYQKQMLDALYDHPQAAVFTPII